MNIPKRKRALRMVVLVIALCIVAGGWFSYQAGRTSAAPSVSPAVTAQVLEVDCPSSVTVGSTYSKVQDIGDFSTQSPESLVEITFNARLLARTMTGNGVRFEIRVDDQPSPIGRARAVFRSDEASNDGGIQASITAVYDNLSAGPHTLSLWAQATNSGSATGVMSDPGCFHNDHAVIKEFLPFGAVALPLVMGE